MTSWHLQRSRSWPDHGQIRVSKTAGLMLRPVSVSTNRSRSAIETRYRSAQVFASSIETTGFDTQHIQGWTIAHLDEASASMSPASTKQRPSGPGRKKSMTKTNEGWEVGLQAGAQIVAETHHADEHVGAQSRWL